MTTKILDCTLRDGGYYNKWFFNHNLVKSYLNLMDDLHVDYVEIGFRKKDIEKKFGDFFSIKDNQILEFTKNKKFKISIMIDLSDFKKDLKIKELFKKQKFTKIDLVRIASDYEDLHFLNKIIKQLHALGYRVAVNLMKATIYDADQIFKFFNQINSKKVEFFYIADSYGNGTPDFIKKIKLKFIKEGFDLNKLGFHAHDNIDTALKNALTAKKCKFGIVDTSVMGMGRGAGNLKLEEYLKYENDFLNKKKLQNFILNKFKPLKKEFRWGSNKFYKFAAKNFIHPTYIQRLLEDKKFNLKQINYILNFLKKEKASKYDLNVFDKFFYKKKLSNSNKSKKFIFLKKSVKIVLNNFKNIKKILSRKEGDYYTALLNYSNYINMKNLDFLFLCNPYRLMTESKFLKKFKNYLVVPRNAKNQITLKNKMTFYYDIFFGKKLLINKQHCEFNLNLVLVHAIAFFISNNFSKIEIYGLSRNKYNDHLLDKISSYIKQKRLKTKIYTK